MAFNFDFYDKHKEMRRYWPLSKEFAKRAILVSQLWKAGEIPDTPAEHQEFLYGRMLDCLARAGASYVARERNLNFLRKIIKNPATAIFIDLMRGTESNYFIEWVQDAMEANAFALEPAYGYGRDITNNYSKMPSYDPSVAMMDDIGFEYVRWRDQKMSAMMRNTGKCGKILSIASGTMPELRHCGYPKWLFETQHFVCYDLAEIDYPMLFETVDMPVDPIHPYQMSLVDALKEESRYIGQRKYDLISIKGYLSYALTSLPEILMAVVGLLQKPGSKFGFDLQLKNWILDRDMWLLMWARGSAGKFELLKDYETAQKLISNIVNGNNLPVDMEISRPGFSNDDATGVFVTLTKRA